MTKKKLAGWFCAYTPEEVLIAAGYDPVRLVTPLESPSAGQAYFPTNFCPYLKNCLGLFAEKKDEKGENSRFDALVFANSCDSLRRAKDVFQFYLASAHIRGHEPDEALPTIVLIDVPHRKDKPGLEFFKSQIKKMASEAGLSSEEALLDAIDLLNVIRSELFELSRLVFQPGEHLLASKFYGLVLEIMRSPKAEAVARIKRFRRELCGYMSRSNCAHKVFLSGNILNQTLLIEEIEKAGAQVVGDDLCTGSRYFERTIDAKGAPFERLALGYLERPPCARMVPSEERLSALRKKILGAQADKVIYVTVKFCDCSLHEFPIVRAMLAQEGIPVLLIETEDRASSTGQVRTRIQAFLEC